MNRPLLILTAAISAVLIPSSFSGTPVFAQTAPKPAAGRITAATNVTLRSLPNAASTAVAQIPLGTELSDSSPLGLDRTWIRVKLADGREGWLKGDLTRTFETGWRWPTFDRIISERLSRKGDGFAAQAELVAFIERVATEYTDPNGRARIDLARLRAIQAALGAIPFNGASRDPYASFVDAHKNDVTYDTPAGRWLLSSAPIWDLQTKHASTTMADEIAWFAVTNGLPGECEGYLPCYIRWRNRLQGEYLRRQPNGLHAEQAVGLIKETADALTAPPKPNEAYDFERTRDCRDLTASIDALISAVKGTKALSRDTAIASLNGLRKVCGG